MQRHPSLVSLSREHHHALVLARKLQDNRVRADELLAIWNNVLLPHLRIEDRELIPIGCCGSEPLRRLTETIAADHASLRQMFGKLDDQAPDDVRATISGRLEEHIRLEERSWFPAIEAQLDTHALSVLARRLQETPEAAIAGYHQDDEGDRDTTRMTRETGWLSLIVDTVNTSATNHPFKMQPG